MYLIYFLLLFSKMLLQCSDANKACCCCNHLWLNCTSVITSKFLIPRKQDLYAVIPMAGPAQDLYGIN